MDEQIAPNIDLLDYSCSANYDADDEKCSVENLARPDTEEQAGRETQAMLNARSNYSLSSLALPPHAALYPHIYGSKVQTQETLVSHAAPSVLRTTCECSGCSCLLAAMDCSAGASDMAIGGCFQECPMECRKPHSAIHRQYRKRLSGGRFTSCSCEYFKRSQASVPILNDEFLQKELHRAMDTFLVSDRKRHKRVTIREFRKKANQVVRALRGTDTPFGVGRKWARTFLKKIGLGIIRPGEITHAVRQHRRHWKKVLLARHLLDCAKAASRHRSSLNIQDPFPFLYWQPIDTGRREPPLESVD